MATSRTIVYVGQMGADTFTQALEGVFYIQKIKLASWRTGFYGQKDKLELWQTESSM